MCMTITDDDLLRQIKGYTLQRWSEIMEATQVDLEEKAEMFSLENFLNLFSDISVSSSSPSFDLNHPDTVCFTGGLCYL